MKFSMTGQEKMTACSFLMTIYMIVEINEQCVHIIWHMDTYSIIQANIKMSGAVDNSFQLVMVT
jgi:hypothetical protein